MPSINKDAVSKDVVMEVQPDDVQVEVVMQADEPPEGSDVAWERMSENGVYINQNYAWLVFGEDMIQLTNADVIRREGPNLVFCYFNVTEKGTPVTSRYVIPFETAAGPINMFRNIMQMTARNGACLNVVKQNKHTGEDYAYGLSPSEISSLLDEGNEWLLDRIKKEDGEINSDIKIELLDIDDKNIATYHNTASITPYERRSTMRVHIRYFGYMVADFYTWQTVTPELNLSGWKGEADFVDLWKTYGEVVGLLWERVSKPMTGTGRDC